MNITLTASAVLQEKIQSLQWEREQMYLMEADDSYLYKRDKYAAHRARVKQLTAEIQRLERDRRGERDGAQ